ncbi:MAG: leucine-rich repeat protein [Lachnospiraceae bacterium]|nr:leucine-rich repeat protein [Lachnospiraceae bacterium]
MANKKVQNEVTQTEVKKKGRRLKRSVRKTFGALFLASAIAVAAIPTDNLQVQAAVAATKLTWVEKNSSSSTIPLIPTDYDKIYSDENGDFVFAWVEDQRSYVAVIIGYNSQTLPQVNGLNTLEIPDTVDAYTQLSDTQGTRTGYVAVSQSGKPLYYKEEADESVSGGDAEASYLPCYRTTKNTWKYTDAANTVERQPTDFYYLNDDGKTYTQVSDENDYWIHNVTVKYISNQYLKDKSDKASKYEVASANYNTDPDKGVFANQGNIQQLIVGPNLVGIGNYAFYNCTGLIGIKLGNGIAEIGHDAFAECLALKDVDFGGANNLTYISDYTFKNCTSLTEFTLSPGIRKVYDHAFEGCNKIESVELTNVNELGIYVFYGCKKLTTVTLPDTLTGEVHLNNFAGCQLKWIQVINSNTIPITDDSEEDVGKVYSVSNFKADMGDEFYFIGPGESQTHEYTKENAIAFKYDNEDIFEIIIIEKGTSEQNVKLTYQVNSNNELLYFNMEDVVKEVTIPEKIGPHGVSTINRGSFGGGIGSCYLEKITIPATVKEINSEAFKGCHNLKHVIFTDASSIEKIESDAFETQEMMGAHSTTCQNENYLENKNPTLTFTGAVGTDIVPFNYAMNKDNYINAGGQNPSYITYYSGWPSNLEIQYVYDNPSTREGAATLVDYPTADDLINASSDPKYTEEKYPYITKDREEAAVKSAWNKYNEATGEFDPTASAYEIAIVNAVLNVSVPEGVKRIADGLFSGKTTIKTAVEGKEDTYTYEVVDVDGQSADTHVKTVTFADIDEFEPYSFTGCKSLTTITITGGKAALDDFAFAYEYDTPKSSDNGGDGEGSQSALTTVILEGGGSSVGDYAFNNNEKLTNVKLSNAVSSLGLRPFKDCPRLNDVDFSGGEYFVTDKAIIFGLSQGEKKTIVQCLESRGTVNGGGTGTTVNASELTGVTKMCPEAFMDTNVGTINLTSSKIEIIPEYAFANTGQISVSLPEGCAEIREYAFQNSDVRFVDVPTTVVIIDNNAFNTSKNPRTDGKDLPFITLYCEEGSVAYRYASNHDNIIADPDRPDTTLCTVYFWDYKDPKDKSTVYLFDTQEVLKGGDAKDPGDPDPKEGWTFVEWSPSYKEIGKVEQDIYAYYVPYTGEEYTLTYADNLDDTIHCVQTYKEGATVYAPNDPVKAGYIFLGWVPSLPKTMTADATVYATWRVAQAGEDDGTGSGGSGNDGNGGSGNGGNGNGGSGSDGTGNGGSGSDGTGNGSSGSDSGTFYVLTVQNGSGSGSYKEGQQPVIIANDPANGQVFDHWSVSPDDVKIASLVLSASIITMPAKDVTVTAHYKAGSSSSTGGGNTGSGNNSQRPSSGSGTVTNGGTTVVIDKNGLSNTGVVSATVNGSSDNFTIKITESNAATEAALRALMAEYGSLDNIKYFPMDISLYDSTGTYKITDTTGISVTITLPLPDSLIPYAGNNRAASVVNERLERLSARFTTIQGVSCITFTAEHFSPYVIYVNTGNLSSGEVSDDTPKTGDFVHPKWFLSIALACMSFVLFMQKDARRPKKVKVKAKAR